MKVFFYGLLVLGILTGILHYYQSIFTENLVLKDKITYEKILNSPKELFTGDCLTGYIFKTNFLDENNTKQYFFLPKTDYNDWLNNVNTWDCLNSLKNKYPNNFNKIAITNDGVKIGEILVWWQYNN